MSKVYEILTQNILTALENCDVPWRKPWKSDNLSARNALTGKDYRGINAFLLPWLAGDVSTSMAFATFKQAKALGANIPKGAKGFPVYFYSVVDKDDGTFFPVFRYSTVFPVDIMENVDMSKWIKPANPAHDPIQAAEDIIANYKGPTIKHGGNVAAYSPALDTCRIPANGDFSSAPEYYSTVFHELAHSTGHASRLNRKGITDSAGFASHEYSIEELIAEFASAMLMQHAGIESPAFDNSVAYIKGWSKAIRQDKTLIAKAASAAQKAVDLILGVNPYAEPEPTE